MMTCKQCQAYQLVAMLEPEKLTPAVQAAIAEHQARCKACHDSAAQLQLVQEALSPSATPETLMQETHANVMAAVRRKQAAQPWRKVIRWAGASAAVALIGVGVWHFRAKSENVPPETIAFTPTPTNPPAIQDLQSATIAEVVEKPKALSEVEESPLVLAFEQAADVKGAFKLLTVAYEEAANRPEGGDFYEIIALCEELRGKWPESKESLEAMKLISHCYTQMAEHQKAQECFLAYADESGERARQRLIARNANEEDIAAEAQRVTSNIILDEAKSLFRHDKSNLFMNYCDVLLTRYPKTEVSWTALYIVASYCRNERNRPETARVLEQIVSEAPPESFSAYLARKELPGALFKAGRKAEAVDAWLQYSEFATEPREKACGLYGAGVLMKFRGKEYYAEAERLLKEVVELYPETGYVAEAKRELASMRLPEWSQEKRVPNPKDILENQKPIDVLVL